MNREEAEEYAKNMTYRDAVYNALQGKCIPYRKATFIKLYELLDKLEQEPLCEDAISRRAVKEQMLKYGFHAPDMTVTEFIENLPPVNPQPQPKTGHWILTNDEDYEYCTCSECGYQNGENWMIGSHIKFCQECGAKMIESQGSEDKE